MDIYDLYEYSFEFFDQLLWWKWLIVLSVVVPIIWKIAKISVKLLCEIVIAICD